MPMIYFPSLLLRTGALLLTTVACQTESTVVAPTAPPVAHVATGSLGLAGDPADVAATTTGGTVLMGGSVEVDAAMRWMISKAGGGDFLVIRASGTDAYNPYVFAELGGVNSCETLLLNSRTLANDPEVEAKIRGAEAVFIAGGDQANYVNYWKDTKVEEALNYLRNTKQVPIGGTSAGCAIMGRDYFAALNGTVTSDEALRNPYVSKVTLGRNDFVDNPWLTNTITDTHFNNPDRRGRLVAFLARINKDNATSGARGIGVDEQTAVCVEPNGTAKVFGLGKAYFLQQNGATNTPETCISGTRLQWYRNKQAVKAYVVPGTATGTGTFDLTTWQNGSGGTSQFFYVDRGKFYAN
ncbi:cyanophycinase [Hymenobacter sp. BT18]|uniref:cyanophycinase n=1 Tax=Hymenobacter sp. BT18 TaxID=2835648 RepID=UPI001E56557E|nr:cyanophycinase [Hymenobacter sp. BT18]